MHCRDNFTIASDAKWIQTLFLIASRTRDHGTTYTRVRKERRTVRRCCILVSEDRLSCSIVYRKSNNRSNRRRRTDPTLERRKKIRYPPYPKKDKVLDHACRCLKKKRHHWTRVSYLFNHVVSRDAEKQERVRHAFHNQRQQRDF